MKYDNDCFVREKGTLFVLIEKYIAYFVKCLFDIVRRFQYFLKAPILKH